MHSRRTFLGGLLAAGAAGLSSPSEDLAWLSLEEAGELARLKKTSAVELTRACLGRIEKLNPALNAFITVTPEQALAQARALEKELASGRMRGPLHGIPIALKDLLDTAGVRTTAASAQYADRVPREDAEVVRRLKSAGAVIVGKLNMDEFAYNFTSETSYFGPIRNPWDRKRSPGGSSGGSAAAVAAGMCFGAVGSDTGGSIRLPASFCGITGLKPSYGRVSAHGVAPLAWSLDHVGPMCRTARDAARMLAAMTGREDKTPAQPVKAMRLGVPRTTFYDGLDPEVRSAVGAALKELSRIAASVKDVVLPSLPGFPAMPELPQVYSEIIITEAYAFHEEMLKRRPDRYHAGTRQSIEGGASTSAAAYIRARREMDRLRAESARLFANADMLITPTAPAPAFELGSRPGLVFLRNTAPWNLYGLPSVSIPCGFTKAGLPIGLQISGPAGRDGAVLALAAAWQQATAFHKKRPPV